MKFGKYSIFLNMPIIFKSVTFIAFSNSSGAKTAAGKPSSSAHSLITVMSKLSPADIWPPTVLSYLPEFSALILLLFCR